MPSIGSPVTRVGSHKSVANYKSGLRGWSRPTLQHVCSLISSHTPDTTTSSVPLHRQKGRFYSNKTKYIT
ncbi:hypothetical protein PFLUV_G00200370 [Perca fluviatilis]|uniref:Uncharacterized protein n=1 Tax=Perca fluviatilis TaxID=8168 RepID=A0A6A5ENC0_PERFL|nr:hypothetical protein PFLUV_G00200370 [Perca fluviatilis]